MNQKFISTILTISMLSSLSVPAFAAQSTSELPYTDIPKSDPNYDIICQVHEAGLMRGVSPDRFSPDTAVTYAMISQILYNLQDKPTLPQDGSPLANIPETAWFAPAVQWAWQNHILKIGRASCRERVSWYV